MPSSSASASQDPSKQAKPEASAGRDHTESPEVITPKVSRRELKSGEVALPGERVVTDWKTKKVYAEKVVSEPTKTSTDAKGAGGNQHREQIFFKSHFFLERDFIERP